MSRFDEQIKEDGTIKMERKLIEEEAERLESLHAYMVLDEGEPCMVWAESRAEFDGPAIRLSDRAVCAYICEAMIDQSKMFHSLTETITRESEVAMKQQESMAQMLAGISQPMQPIGEDSKGETVYAGDIVKHTTLGEEGQAFGCEGDCFKVQLTNGPDVTWNREEVEKTMMVLPVDAEAEVEDE